MPWALPLPLISLAQPQHLVPIRSVARGAVPDAPDPRARHKANLNCPSGARQPRGAEPDGLPRARW